MATTILCGWLSAYPRPFVPAARVKLRQHQASTLDEGRMQEAFQDLIRPPSEMSECDMAVFARTCMDEYRGVGVKGL